MKNENRETCDDTIRVNRCSSVARVCPLASRASIFTVHRVLTMAVFAALVTSVPLLQAQHGSMSGGIPAGMGGSAGAPIAHVGAGGGPHGGPNGVPHNPNGGPHPGLVGGGHHHRGGVRNNRPVGNNVFLGSPYWGGSYWDDGDGAVVYEQPPAPAEGAPIQQQRVVEPSRPAAEPLIIEWQGDRYVRSGGQIAGTQNGAQNQAAVPRDYFETPRSSSKAAQQSLPPAVLAFRNGTRQEVNSYTIVGRTLYASGDYWTQGYWTKTIQLADLDLPETIRLNQQRGVPFKLPTAPNDIITRP